MHQFLSFQLKIFVLQFLLCFDETGFTEIFLLLRTLQTFSRKWSDLIHFNSFHFNYLLSQNKQKFKQSKGIIVFTALLLYHAALWTSDHNMRGILNQSFYLSCDEWEKHLAIKACEQETGLHQHWCCILLELEVM